MDNIFESIAAATKPMDDIFDSMAVTIEAFTEDDRKKLDEMHNKFMEIANSYVFSTIPGCDASSDVKNGLRLMRECIQVKCKP